jgi:Na+-transporting NADH:ubiquinone oxidoreductase subunit NqrF
MSAQGRTRSHRTERGIIFISGACGGRREVAAGSVDVYEDEGERVAMEQMGGSMQRARSSTRGVKEGV